MQICIFMQRQALRLAAVVVNANTAFDLLMVHGKHPLTKWGWWKYRKKKHWWFSHCWGLQACSGWEVVGLVFAQLFTWVFCTSQVELPGFAVFLGYFFSNIILPQLLEVKNSYWSPTNRGWNGWTASAISHVWLQYNHITVASLLWFKHPKIPSTMIWFLCTNLSPLRCHQSACLLMLLSTDVAIHSISHLNRSSVCYDLKKTWTSGVS